MIALWLGVAAAAPVDVERARAALEVGDAPLAVEHARVALSEAPTDWRAWWVYVEALDAAGLDHRIEAELAAPADARPELAAIRSLARARAGDRAATALAALSEGEGEVGRLVMATLSLERGAPNVAVAMLPDPTLPESHGARLAAAVASGDTRGARDHLDALLRTAPDRADLWIPLYDLDGEPDRHLRAARTDAERAATRRLAAPDVDPAELHRLRRFFLASGHESVDACVEALVRRGEPRLPSSAPLSPSERAARAKGLVRTRNPALPDTGDGEADRALGLAMIGSLVALGRVPEALVLYDGLRGRRDDAELAELHARQLLRAGRVRDALPVAAAAVRLAARPATDDLDRSDVEASRYDLASALAVSAEVKFRAEDYDGAGADAAAAALLVPTAETWALRATVAAAVGDDEVAFTALAVARALGAPVDGELEQMYAGAGFWADAARDAAARYAANAGFELPERGADGLPARPDRPLEGAPFPDVATAEGDRLVRPGRVVVVVFFASWCGPCRREIPEIAAKYEAWRQAGLPVDVVAISTDDTDDAVTRLRERLDFGAIEVHRDPDLGDRLGVSGLPTTYVIDREGIAASFHQGYGPESGAALDEQIRDLAAP